ncbi:response regulator transcription factor [Shewanella algae]|uniref:response regulator transcription factor n=1 Tax=Shewanella algae TaxID=38313 RepID=UPI001F37C886|nr:response regulator transcription factor [Shewanella algae]MCE9785417.1 response regulator transcription factor [Shewanella algae]
MKSKTVVIIDDHPVVLISLQIILERHGYSVLGSASNGIDGIKMIKERSPKLAVLDIGIPKLDGFEVINRLKTIEQPPKILVLTAQPSEYFSTRCIEAGASGFVSKQEDLTIVINALQAIQAGYTYFPNQNNAFSNKISSLTEEDKLKTLSSREMMVLQQLAIGFSNKEIAESMLLSNKTISTYKSRLLTKLDAKNLVDLIEIAKRNNIK